MHTRDRHPGLPVVVGKPRPAWRRHQRSGKNEIFSSHPNLFES